MAMDNNYNTNQKPTEDAASASLEGETSPAETGDFQSDTFQSLESEAPDSSNPHWSSTASPEPPARWNPAEPDARQYKATKRFDNSNVTGMGVIGKTRFPLKSDEIPVFQSARRLIITSQIVSAVSLFLGGVLLSAVAVICAIVGFGKLNRLALARPEDPDAQRALKRSGWIALAITVGVLALNVFALIYLYPMFADTLQNAGLGNLAGSSPTGAGSANTTWG